MEDLEQTIRAWAVDQVRQHPGRYSQSSLREDIETIARNSWRSIRDAVEDGRIEVKADGSRRRLYPST